MAPPAQQYRSEPTVSPAELAAPKAMRDKVNVYITVYVASVLLVAAAALFGSLSLPAAVKFACVFSSRQFYTRWVL